MAVLPDVFVADPDAAPSGFEPIPAGWYEAEITKSELKTAKSGGKYLSLQFKVIGGTHHGRYVFTNLNLVNANPTTVEIARRDLNSICLACGLEQVEDSVELHGIPLAIKVKVTPGDANWPPRNDIKEYRELSDMPDDEDVNPFA